MVMALFVKNHNEFLNTMERQEYQRAEEKLKRIQDKGLDTIVLNITGANSGEYPLYERNILDKITNSKKEYKSYSESSTDYIKRIAKEGKLILSNDIFYLIKDDIGLKFTNLGNPIMKELEGILTIWAGLDEDELVIPKDIKSYKHSNSKYYAEGIVPIRVHSYSMNYLGWTNSKNVKSIIENPLKSYLNKIVVFKEENI
jgi:hypothetical protein